MGRQTNRDGNSGTASAVDELDYPEQYEVDSRFSQEDLQSEIAHRAHELWIERGCRYGSHEQDWLDAEREVRAKKASMSTRKIDDVSGAVQR